MVLCGNYDTKCQLFHRTSVVSCLPEFSKNVQSHTYCKQSSHGLYIQMRKLQHKRSRYFLHEHHINVYSEVKVGIKSTASVASVAFANEHQLSEIRETIRASIRKVSNVLGYPKLRRKYFLKKSVYINSCSASYHRERTFSFICSYQVSFYGH